MTIHCSSWCASLSSSLLLFLPFLSPTQQRTSLRFFHTSRKYLCSCEVFVFKPCEMPLPSLLSSFLFFRSLSFSSFFENEICSVLVIATRRLVWTPRRRAGEAQRVQTQLNRKTRAAVKYNGSCRHASEDKRHCADFKWNWQLVRSRAAHSWADKFLVERKSILNVFWAMSCSRSCVRDYACREKISWNVSLILSWSDYCHRYTDEVWNQYLVYKSICRIT